MTQTSVEEIADQNPKLVNSLLVCYFGYKLVYTILIAAVLFFVDASWDSRVLLFLEVWLDIGMLELVVLTIRYFMYFYILFGEGRGACVTCATLLIKTLLMLITIFMLAWYVTGNVWFYSESNDCLSDFPEAYWLTFSLLVIFYIFATISCSVGFSCMITCISAVTH